MKKGGALPGALNAADEVAVAAFLEQLPFLGIPEVIERVLARTPELRLIPSKMSLPPTPKPAASPAKKSPHSPPNPSRPANAAFCPSLSCVGIPSEAVPPTIQPSMN